jgi:hypothetical protein
MLPEEPPGYEPTGARGALTGRFPGRTNSGSMPQTRPPQQEWDEQELEEAPPGLPSSKQPQQRQRGPVTAERDPRALAWDDALFQGWETPPSLGVSSALNALLGAALGGLLGAVGWLAVTIVTSMTLPYLALLVGLLAGLGARLALVQTRPWSVGLFAALGTLLAFVAAQYGLFDYGLASQQAHQGLFSNWFPLSPVQFISVYWDYVIGVANEVNKQLGQTADTHPQAMLQALIAVAACWCLLIRQKL